MGTKLENAFRKALGFTTKANPKCPDCAESVIYDEVLQCYVHVNKYAPCYLNATTVWEENDANTRKDV